MSWYNLPSPSLATSGHLQPLPPPLHSNSAAYLCNLCNCIMPTLGLTVDQYWTCSDLVPMPRAAVVGGIVPCVLNSLIIMSLYHGNYGRTWTSEITKNRGRLTWTQ